MAEAADSLVLALVERVAREPRPYQEVIAAWRTSCPRLTIWEDAVDRGYVTRAGASGSRAMVVVTADGREWLRTHGRLSGLMMDFWGMMNAPGLARAGTFAVAVAVLAMFDAAPGFAADKV